MLGKLLLLFTVVPVVELYLLITLGQALGAELTIGLVLVTGLLGASLAKREGARVLRNWQESVQRGELPKEGVISSLLVLVGGVLLVTPGVVTDATGLLLLVPWSRRIVANILRSRLEHRFQLQGMSAGPAAFMNMGAPMGQGQGPVIDVDAVETDAHDAEAQPAPSSSTPIDTTASNAR